MTLLLFILFCITAGLLMGRIFKNLKLNQLLNESEHWKMTYLRQREEIDAAYKKREKRTQEILMDINQLLDDNIKKRHAAEQSAKAAHADWEAMTEKRQEYQTKYEKLFHEIDLLKAEHAKQLSAAELAKNNLVKRYRELEQKHERELSENINAVHGLAQTAMEKVYKEISDKVSEVTKDFVTKKNSLDKVKKITEEFNADDDVAVSRFPRSSCFPNKY